MDGLDEYLASIRARWTDVVSTVNGEDATHAPRRTIAVTETQRRPLLGGIDPVIIAGYRGVGKSALMHELVRDGGYVRRRDESHRPHRLVVSNGRDKANITLIVTTGQTTGDEFANGEIDQWDAMLKAPNFPAGVIYVAAAGYDEPWTPGDIGALESRRQARERDLRKTISAELMTLWEKSLRQEPTAEQRRVRELEIFDEASSLLPSASAQLWEQNRSVELGHFQRFCQNLSTSWADVPQSESLWLIVAVSKADLYWEDQLPEIEQYYVPAAEPQLRSHFQTALLDLVGMFHPKHRPRIAVVPVAGRRQDYKFLPDVGTKDSKFDDMKFDAIQRCFRGTLGEFCGLKG